MRPAPAQAPAPVSPSTDRPQARRRPTEAARLRRRRLALEGLEPRALLATLPAPTVIGRDNGQIGLLSDPTNLTNESTPSIAASPNDPLKLVAVWSSGLAVPTAASAIRTQGAFSVDGGLNWQALALPLPIFDPLAAPTATTRLTRALDASVAFGRDGSVYIVDAQHFTASARGALVMQKLDFRGAAPVPAIADKILYAWNTDAAIDPIVAVDDTLSTYVDPRTGATVTNPFSGNVYVAWGTDDSLGSPNTIKIVASSDGGQSFTPRRTVNDEQDGLGVFFQPTAPGVFPANVSGNTGIQLNTQPRLVVSQGTADGRVAPGQVTVVWDDFGSGTAQNPPVDLIRSDRLGGGIGQTFTASGVIRQATATANPRVTDFPITVNISDPRFTTVADLDVRLGIVHPSMASLSVTLIAPDGRTLPLVAAGAAGGGALGVGGGRTAFGTVFDQEAITPLGGGVTPFVGSFVPAFQVPAAAPNPVTTFNLSDFYGLNALQVGGTWTIRIANTSTAFDPANPPQLVEGSLIFGSGLTPGVDRLVATTTVLGTLTSDAPGGNKQPFPLFGPLAPVQFDRGIGPAPALAADNAPTGLRGTAGRLYVAYVDVQATSTRADNTDVMLVHSDDGGLSWSAPRMVNDDVDSRLDGFSQSLVTPTQAIGRPQFMPALAVDQATGTLAAAFYDARHDGQRVRAAMTVTTSLDGGATFSPQSQSFVNAANAPFDEIIRSTVVLGPIPDNLSAGNPTAGNIRENVQGQGFGDRQGLAFANGNVYVAWAGNENGGARGLNRLDVRVARATTAAGPRVIESTMGPVRALTSDGLTFNAGFAADGAPLLEGFRVRFDRPVDVPSFTPADVVVRRRSPSDPSGQIGALVAVASVAPLDPTGPNGRQATNFFVRFATPQSATGTYAYSVGPDVLDFGGGARLTTVPGTGPLAFGPAAALPFSAVELPLLVPDTGVPILVDLPVVGFPDDAVVSDVDVNLSIDHTKVGDLDLILIAPNGTRVVLSSGNGGNGANYTDTTFDDDATVAIAAAAPPFTGRFRPEQPLSAVNGVLANGNWRLEVGDSVPGVVGMLRSFSLTIRTGATVGQVPLAVPDLDTGFATQEVAGVPAGAVVADVDVAVTIDHPDAAQLDLFLIAPDGTRVELSTDNGGAGGYNGTTFDDAAGTAITAGAAPFAGTFRPEGSLAAINGKAPNGTWRLEARDDTGGLVGTLRDFRLLLRTTSSYAATDVPRAVPDLGQAISRITVADLPANSTIADLDATISINHPNVADLDVFLVAPDGTRVELTTDNGGTGDNYVNTIFDDQAGPSIVGSAAPFTGRFRPEGSLAALNFRNANGTWRLEVTDDTGGNTGTIAAFGLAIQTAAAYGKTALPIPDRGLAVSTLPVATAPTGDRITDVDVTIDLTHPAVGDLDVFLVAPDGTRVELVSDNPVVGADYRNTTFDDAAATAIAAGVAPFTGRFRPAGALSAFIGKAAAGLWRLEIADDTAANVGILNGWSLALRTASGPFASSDVPLAIPENPGFEVSSLSVSGLPSGVKVNDVNVTLTINHPRAADLAIFLVAPNGARVELTSGNGGTGANYTGTTFDDDAVDANGNPVQLITAAAAPFTGIFRPEALLSGLDGSVANGTWGLELRDTVTGNPVAIGTLTSWSIALETTALYGDVPLGVPDNDAAITTLTVAGLSATDGIDDLDVTLTIDHPDVGELDVFLVAPDGTRIELVTDNPAGGANYAGTTFDDQATTDVTAGTAPFTGRFVPASPLAGLNARAGNGVWRLEVSDDTTNAPTGLVRGFALRLRTASTFGKLPVVVPDLGVAVAPLVVAGLPATDVIADVDVTVSIAHPNLADLVLTLVAPDGTRVLLANAVGGIGDDFIGTIFDDQAAVAIGAGVAPALAPFTGRFVPASPLAVLNGRSPNGNWRLEVRDLAGNGNVGTITDFVLGLRTVPRFIASAVPTAIPDVGTVAVPVVVAGFAPGDGIADVDVTVTITHPKVNDLTLVLEAPDGTRVRLSKPTAAGVSFVNTVFDDQAATAITAGAAPFTGRFRPEQPLSAFNGRDGNGTWRLLVTDATANSIGTIDGLTLAIQTATLAGRLPLPIPDLGSATAVARVSGFPANEVISDVNVNVTIDHPKASNLTLFLVAPDGTQVRLARNLGGATGANYTGTVFDDQGPAPIATAAAPFTGTFRPEQPLAAFNGRPANGNWRLRVVDAATATIPDEGTIVDFSLTIATVRRVVTIVAGNPMDQDADGRPGETALPGQTGSDAYSTPRSLSSIPFQFPFDPTTLPLIVPGPMIASTAVPGAPATIDNLVTDATVSALDVTFDRDMDPTSFTVDDVLQILGPDGAVAGPFGVAAQSARTFRVSFPTQQLSGTYSILLGSDIRSAAGDRLDTNKNAGLDALRGTVDPATGQTVELTVQAASPEVPLTIPRASTVVSRIAVTDDFLIQDLNVRLNITFPNDPALTATLVALDPTGNSMGDRSVLLFSGVGNTGSQANFTDTVFDDQAPRPIQNGGPPFLDGPFNPQVGGGLSLDNLRNESARRTYELRITNASNALTDVGTLNSWSLIFRRPVPTTGLAEPVADRATASFRIFNMAPSNPLSASTWTAVGPAGTGAREPSGNAEVSGRIGALAVDPSDPSGNTVFVAGASGGIWKTTNFLTADPKGPTYVPLTDFGPSFGLAVSGITVVARNNDPNQSIVVAATGDGEALGDPLRPSDLTSRGVGFLRSLDGGATWELLDSRDNTRPFGQRDHFFAAGNGTAAYRIVSDPRLSDAGTAILYAALSDRDPDGTDTFNQVIAARGDTIRGGLWRSTDSGDTWVQLRPGQATDVVLDPNSATGSVDGNLQFLYAAFRNDGIFFSSNRGQLLSPLPGVTGDPLIQNADLLGPTGQPQPVAVVGPPPQAPQPGTVGSNRPTPNSYLAAPGQPATTPPAVDPSLGRILLAKPALTGNSLQDGIYQGWLYAAVMVHNGDLVQIPPFPQPPSSLFRIFVTKDFGQNWTPVIAPTAGLLPTNAHNPINPVAFTSTIDATGNGSPVGNYYFKGNFSSALAVDPNDPNVIYFGGTDMFQEYGLIRIDTTGIADPHAFYLSNDDTNTDPTIGVFRTYAGHATSVPLSAPLAINAVGSPLTLYSPSPPFPYYGPRDLALAAQPGVFNPIDTPFLNLIRDPLQPFVGGATILVQGVARFNNTGNHATYVPFDQALQPDPFDDQAQNPNGTPNTWARPTRGLHRIVTLRDPLTGRTRLIFGNDNGVYTAVDEGDGTLVGSIGGVVDPSTTAGDLAIVNGSRNGNLQIAQFRAGAIQPSFLSGQLAVLQGMIYGNGEDSGQPQSDPNVLTVGASGYGNISWVGPTRESGFGVATEQNFVPVGGVNTVRGFVYHFENPEGLVERDFEGDGFHPATDFFQVDNVSRTFGLNQTSFVDDVPDPQWPFRRGFDFAVNPINGDQIVIGSASGRVFGTETAGRVWSQIAAPSVLDQTQVLALAYGSPQAPPLGSGDQGDFLYAGTIGGRTFVTFTGGGANPTDWRDISAGLDGSPIASIITNPDSASREAYAVTAGGIRRQFNGPANTAIPDNGTLPSTLTIGDDVYLRSLAVNLTINHPQVAELRVTLIAPDGTRVRLVAGGVAGANFTNTTFDDAAPLALAQGVAPFTGTFRPLDSLDAQLYGRNMRGDWTLEVVDTVAGNTGNLTGWSLQPLTLGGVYHLVDSGPGAGARWEGVTGDLFLQTHDIFGDPSQAEFRLKYLTSIVADWRFVVPDDPAAPTGPSHPVLYVGGLGGVYRSLDDGQTWVAFPSAESGSLDTTPDPPGDGGGLPVALVTDLDLSLGAIDPATGRPNPVAAVGPNVLVATTYGRGAFAIRLTPTVSTTTVRLSPTLPAPPGPALGGSDTGSSFTDRVTGVRAPVIEGFSQQSAFGAVVTVEIFDLTPTTPGGPLQDPATAPQIGVGQTDPNGGFSILVQAFASDGEKTLGIRATDQAGTTGNVALFTFTIDTVAPADTDEPDLQAASDTGPSNTDDITSVRNPIFDVTGVEPSALLQLLRDGVVVTTLVGVAGGTVAIQDTSNLADGTYVYSAIQFDQAGNAAPVSTGLTVVITTQGSPGQPGVPDLQDASDSGPSFTDDVTNATAPAFDVIPAQATDTVSLLRRLVPTGPAVSFLSTAVPRAIPDLGQTSSFIQVFAFPANQVVFDVDVTLSITHTFVSDLVIRLVSPSGTEVVLAQQVGGAGQDFVGTTFDDAAAQPIGAGVAPFSASFRPQQPLGTLAEELVNGTWFLEIDDVGAGDVGTLTAWSLAIVAADPYTVVGQRTGPGAIVDGTLAAQVPIDGVYSYVSQILTAGGLLQPISDELRVTIDTTVPAAPGAPDLLSSSDTGPSDVDNETSDRSPTFLVAPAEATTLVELLRDGVVVATRTGPGTLTDPGALPDGTYVFTARQTDLAGNVGPASAGLTVRVDNILPVAPSVPDLVAASDSPGPNQPGFVVGVTDSDNITQATLTNLPVFNIAQAESGATVILLRRRLSPNPEPGFTEVNRRLGPGTLADPGPTFLDGIYLYASQQIDGAGNLSAVSAPLTVVLDNTSPAASGAPDLTDASDTGLSTTDNLTSVRNPIFTILGVETNATVRLLRDNVVIATVRNLAGGPVTIQDNGNLAAGSYTYRAVQTDLAGNTAPLSPALTIVVDTTGPTTTPPPPDLAATSDSGSSNTDDLTNLTPRSFALVATDPANVVQLLRDGVVVGQLLGSGTVVDPAALADGTYSYQARESDPAGNFGPASTALVVRIDATAPAAPGAPDLTAATDLGASATDNVTAATAPAFDLAGLEAGATIELLRDGALVATIAAPGPVVDGTSPGTGTYVYTARQVDAAGNRGAAGAGLTVTIDRDVPARPTAPDLTAATDTGVSDTDNLTSSRAPAFTAAGIEAGATVRLLRDGVLVGQRVGPGDVVDATTPVDGIYNYTIVQVDVAGNASPASPALTVTIDGVSAAPGAPNLQPGSDTGRFDNDDVTNARTPSFDVVQAEAGSTVRLLRDGLVVATRTGPGTLTDPTPPANAAVVYTADQVDASGNPSAPSAGLTVTYDTTAPGAPGTPDLTAATDSGASSTDNLTNAASPAFTVGGLEANAAVRLLRNGVAVVTQVGGSVADPGVGLADGTFNYTAQQVDLAGNAGPASPIALAVTIDRTAPVAGAAPDLQAGSDSGASSVDNLTNVTRFGAPQFDLGNVEAGAEARLLRNGTIVAGRTGPGPLADPSTPPDGPQTYTLVVVDAAGNPAAASPALVVTFDTVAPGAPGLTLLAADDTGILGDGRTVRRRPRLTGNAEPGSLVELLDAAGTPIGNAPAGAPTGAFTVQPAANQPNGRLLVRARATDGAGNVGAPGATAAVTLVTAQGDFDADARADRAVFRRRSGTWFVARTTLGGLAQGFGGPVDVPLAADFDGDGAQDLVLFRQSTATWFILGSSTGFGQAIQFGATTDLPVPADFDGDGRTDLAVFRPSTAQWFVLQSGGGSQVVQFGAANIDVPVPADFDGDGRADLAVFRSTTAQWFVLQSGGGSQAVQFGAGNLDVPVPADYDGDNRADFGVFRPAGPAAQWFVLQSAAGPRGVTFGAITDTPVPQDYDGDGRADFAAYRPSTAQWFVLQSTGGSAGTQFGAPDDVPVPAPLRYRLPSGPIGISAAGIFGTGGAGGSGTGSGAGKAAAGTSTGASASATGGSVASAATTGTTGGLNFGRQAANLTTTTAGRSRVAQAAPTVVAPLGPVTVQPIGAPADADDDLVGVAIEALGPVGRRNRARRSS